MTDSAWPLATAAAHFLASFQWLPESARYDVARGHMDSALETLQRIAKDNGKPMPLGKLVDSGNPEGNDDVSKLITCLLVAFCPRESDKRFWWGDFFSNPGVKTQSRCLMGAALAIHQGHAPLQVGAHSDMIHFFKGLKKGSEEDHFSACVL